MRGREILAVIDVEHADRGDLRGWHGALAASAQAGSGPIWVGTCHGSGDADGELGFQSKLVVSN